jgi:hypothetical protein
MSFCVHLTSEWTYSQFVDQHSGRNVVQRLICSVWILYVPVYSWPWSRTTARAASGQRQRSLAVLHQAVKNKPILEQKTYKERTSELRSRSKTGSGITQAKGEPNSKVKSSSQNWIYGLQTKASNTGNFNRCLWHSAEETLTSLLHLRKAQRREGKELCRTWRKFSPLREFANHFRFWDKWLILPRAADVRKETQGSGQLYGELSMDFDSAFRNPRL